MPPPSWGVSRRPSGRSSAFRRWPSARRPGSRSPGSPTWRGAGAAVRPGGPGHGPCDAIAVAAGGPIVPPALLSQLAIGGRLVIPVGDDESSQVLTRVTRVNDTDFREERLIDVRFVPLIGEQAWGGSGELTRAPNVA